MKEGSLEIALKTVPIIISIIALVVAYLSYSQNQKRNKEIKREFNEQYELARKSLLNSISQSRLDVSTRFFLESSKINGYDNYFEPNQDRSVFESVNQLTANIIINVLAGSLSFAYLKLENNGEIYPVMPGNVNKINFKVRGECSCLNFTIVYVGIHNEIISEKFLSFPTYDKGILNTIEIPIPDTIQPTITNNIDNSYLTGGKIIIEPKIYQIKKINLINQMALNGKISDEKIVKIMGENEMSNEKLKEELLSLEDLASEYINNK